MYLLTLTLIFYLYKTMCLSNDVDFYTFKRFSSIDDKIVVQPRIFYTKCRSGIECVDRCAVSQNCVSVFYSNDSICQGHSEVYDRNSHLLVAKQGVVYYVSEDRAVALSQRCPGHWLYYELSCYLFIKDAPEKFIDAGLFCQTEGSTLVEIESAGENAFLRSHITGTNPQYGYWIGLSDSVSEGVWVWTSTQMKAVYNDWLPNQPDDFKGRQDCAMFLARDDFHWDDNLCTVKAGFICEMD